MSKLFDTVNELDVLTGKLKDTERLLRSVCENYFGRTEEATHPAVLHSQYDMFSTLVRMAADQLWDIIDEYRALSKTLTDYNTAMCETAKKGGEII